MREIIPHRWRRLFAFGVLFGSVFRGSSAVEMRPDVEYGRVGDERLLLDARIPDGEGPFPIAILVHGGGWAGGDKATDITPWFEPLTNADFVSLSINYRLAPTHRWPACLEDMTTAIRWAKAHAAAFKGDPSRLVLVGYSAGGHLVSLAALQASDDTRVQAVVGFAPPTDFEQDLVARGGLSKALQDLHGRPQQVTPESLAILRDTSPINHVKTGAPPFLLIQGEQDKSVPLQQSLNFLAKLRASGVRGELIVLPGVGHRLRDWTHADPAYMERVTGWLWQMLGQPVPTHSLRLRCGLPASRCTEALSVSNGRLGAISISFP